VVTIKGDNLPAIITNKGLVLEIGHNHNYEELYNFETIITLEKDLSPFGFDPYINLNMNATLKKWGNLSRPAIGRRTHDWTTFF